MFDDEEKEEDEVRAALEELKTAEQRRNFNQIFGSAHTARSRGSYADAYK